MIDAPGEHTILVTGATGQQGGAVTRHLLDAGFRLRGLTRDAEKPEARQLAGRGVEVVEGDMEDRESLDRALRGVHGAFSVQNTWTAGIDGEIRQGKNLADAAKDAGAGHFVYSSVGSAHRGTGIPHFDSKFEVEKHIRAIGLPATIFRPVFFMENLEGFREQIGEGTFSQPLDAEQTLQMIAVHDIGAFVALAFMNPDEWIGREVDLAGDEPTMRGAARAFGDVIGRPVEFRRMPGEQLRQAMGEEGALMYEWFEEEGYEADIEGLRQIYPGLATLEEYLRRNDWEGAG